MDKEQLLAELVERLSAALGDELISVVLYGSAAAGDYDEKVSDLNVLCVLEHIGPAQLEQAYEPADWWLKRKQPAPVLLSVEELENAHDAFAIEFLDIRNAYRILYGRDLVQSIEIDSLHHRILVEHEMRSRLVRLRERYLALQRDHNAVIELMCDSAPTFSVLFRHALLLSGGEGPRTKREIFREAAGRFGLDAGPFETILDCREGKRKFSDSEIRPVFENYMRAITKMAEAVDRLAAAPVRQEGEQP